MTTVGFIGLGAMGTPMAWNLADAGFDLVVYNRTTDREQPFAEAGVSVADSPKHLTERSDVVCLIVSNGDAVAELLERDLGVLEGVDGDTTVVQMSTIGYAETMAAFAEALVFGRASGLDVEAMRTVVENGALDCPLFDIKGANIGDGDFDPRFPVDYQFKDLSLALDRAGEVGAPLSQTAATREAFSAARACGYGGEDMAAVIKPMAETVGVEVRDD